MLVALTREVGHNEELRRLVGDLAEVVEVPLTQTRYREEGEVAEEIAGLGHAPYASLVVTSARAVPYATRALEFLEQPADILSVGAATTKALAEAALVVRAQSAGTARELAAELDEGPVLILGARHGRQELGDALAARGVGCDVVGCYQTRGVELDAAQEAGLARADVVFIGAPSAWRVARTLVRPEAWVLVPGSTTLAAVLVDHARVRLGWGEDFATAWAEVRSAG